MLTDAEARTAVSSLPWVARSPKSWPRRCDAVRVDGRDDLSAADFADRPRVREEHRCRRRAGWVFVGLDGRISVYCWSHLWWSGLHGSDQEWLRFRSAAYRWDWKNYSPELDPEDEEFPVDSRVDGA